MKGPAGRNNRGRAARKRRWDLSNGKHFAPVSDFVSSSVSRENLFGQRGLKSERKSEVDVYKIAGQGRVWCD